MTSLLQIEIARKRFGARTVLSEVELAVAEGEFVSLVGASGCGKSTLLRIAAGLDRDFEGRVRFDGRPVVEPMREIRFVFQEPRLFPWLAVARNVSFDLEGRAVDAARVASLLEKVGLAGLGNRLPKQLSGGQAQRVAIARALFLQPRLLLLDEPFSAVDAFTRLRLQELLLRVAQAHGITVLLVTHDIDEAVHLSDRVIVLEADPARVAARVDVGLPRPRDRELAGTSAVVTEVRHALQAAHAI